MPQIPNIVTLKKRRGRRRATLMLTSYSGSVARRRPRRRRRHHENSTTIIRPHLIEAGRAHRSDNAARSLKRLAPGAIERGAEQSSSEMEEQPVHDHIELIRQIFRVPFFDRPRDALERYRNRMQREPDLSAWPQHSGDFAE